ncbi:MAG: tetratricopeptide repeat protein [Porticoccaceae bacterium]|nr:tetratricopeptide repeat protein [Porticoccaceae bacterium]
MSQAQQQITQILQTGINVLNQNNPSEAAQYFQQILKRLPNEPNALFLLGAAKRLQGQHSEAISLMKRSLVSHSNPAQVHNGLANAYKDIGENHQAIASYNNALKIQPKFAEALFNLGLLKHDEGALKAAVDHLTAAIKIQPQNPTFHNAIGVIHQERGDLELAETAYKHALMLDNTYFKALHNLGALLRSQFKYKDAIVFLARAVRLEPQAIEPRYILANVYYELGNFAKADEEYRTVITLQPDFVDVHESLNRMYWEHGKKDLYGKSYKIGIKANPSSPELCEKHLRALINAGHSEEGLHHGAIYVDSFPQHPGILYQMARAQACAGHAGAATDTYRKAAARAPQDTSILIGTSQYLIQTGEYHAALNHLEAVEKHAPNDQEMWAYRGLCWRMLGDERYEWLNNFDALIKSTCIDTPAGYANLNEFLAELKETLRQCHTAHHAPIDQTLRGGSQTHGTLFDRQDPIFNTLKEALRQVALGYIRGLPDDKEHPLCKRKNENFDFSASWSVWLKEGGYHINHVHPLGWISSAFYVDVPKATEASRAACQGWIKFGESPLHIGKADKANRLIEPQAGLLALFPSFMWHGTVAYSENADRITTPFDIIPQ